MDVPSINHLSLPEKVGQILNPYFKETEIEQTLEMVEKYHVGTLHVGPCYSPHLVKCLEEVMPKARVPLLVCANLEGGYQEVLGITPFSSLMSIAAIDCEETAYDIGFALGQEAKKVHINWLFTPVVDVNSNPQNPIVNIRSFGDDVARVIRLAKSYVKGIANAGVIPTLKHFPGHGSTQQDSHLMSAYCKHSPELFRDIDLRPFKEIIAETPTAIMTAHMIVPHLDDKLATFSSIILRDLLRKEWKFQGLVVSDALFMRSVTMNYNLEESCREALLAGCDSLIILPDQVSHVFNSLIKDVNDQKIPLEKLDESVQRILEHKKKLENLPENPPLDRNQHYEISRRAAQQAITLIPKTSQTLSPSRFQPSIALTIVGYGKKCEENFIAFLMDKAQQYNITVTPEKLEEIESHNKVHVVVLFNTVKFWSNEITFSNIKMQLAVKKLQQKDSVAIIFGNPYMSLHFKNICPCILAYDTIQITLQSVVEILFGEIEANGKIPVTLC